MSEKLRVLGVGYISKKSLSKIISDCTEVSKKLTNLIKYRQTHRTPKTEFEERSLGVEKWEVNSDEWEVTWKRENVGMELKKLWH